MRDSAVGIPPDSCVPHAALLETWSSKDWTAGIDVTTLSPLDELTVTTCNSVYTILIVCPVSGEVKIRGGRFFPSFVTARIGGSSLGRGFLKRYVVHPGFCLEFTNDDLGLIVTTRVHTAVVSSGGGDAPADAVM